MLFCESDIKNIVLKYYNKNVTKIKKLGSCQDINYQLFCEEGLYLLKFNNPCSKIDELLFQNEVILHLSNSELNNEIIFPIVQEVINTEQHINNIIEVTIENVLYYVRLLTYIDGNIVSNYHYFPYNFLYNFGIFIGKMNQTLLTLQSNYNTNRDIQWDLRNIEKNIKELSNSNQLIKSDQMNKIEAITKKSLIELHSYQDNLRSQIIHGDLAFYNVIAHTNDIKQPYLVGVIDFGDAMNSWLVSDIAVAIVSGFIHCRYKEECLEYTISILKGVHSMYPLLECEIMALWPLICLRSVLNILSISNELQLDNTNEYNLNGLKDEWKVFDYLYDINMYLVQQSCRYELNIPLSTHILSNLASPPYPLVKETLFNNSIILNCSIDSELYENGNWNDNNIESKLVLNLLNNNNSNNDINNNKDIIIMNKYGESKLYLSQTHSLNELPIVSLHCKLYFSSNIDLFTPYNCYIEYNLLSTTTTNTTNTIRMQCDNGLIIIITGNISIKKELNSLQYKAGELFAYTINDHTNPFSTISIQILKSNQLHINEIPLYCTSSMFKYWNLFFLSPDIFLFNNNNKNHSNLEDINHNNNKIDNILTCLQKRNEYVANIQEHYFKNPPQIIRAWKEFMYDSNGRAYLDMVNNVSILGHCHPDIIKASYKQMQLLNTNSRFNYHILGDFAEKIISTLPSGSNLECVFFVNSGSEATDLALRIARTVVSERRKSMIRQRDVICLEGAYHGVTTASDEVSTTLNDNPTSRDSRPPWIHLVPMPNKFRGLHTQSTYYQEHILDNNHNNNNKEEFMTDFYVKHVEDLINNLKQQNKLPTAFIAEPLSGNAGGVEIPLGYLKRVYQAIRNVGGLCIADEVQVGYGRLGTTFWGFQEHDIIPDILTMAKAAGNGHPLGFVVTSKQIAKEFGIDGSFFSSAGGGPVSCTIGYTVLTTLQNENLQYNANVIGTYLHSKLLELALKHKNIIGCIHGHGFYQGIELVKNNNSKEPATKEAYAICERLLQLGVICHNTGDYSNVLKVKPPLVFTKQSADFFISALDIALNGW